MIARQLGNAKKELWNTKVKKPWGIRPSMHWRSKMPGRCWAQLPLIKTVRSFNIFSSLTEFRTNGITQIYGKPQVKIVKIPPSPQSAAIWHRPELLLVKRIFRYTILCKPLCEFYVAIIIEADTAMFGPYIKNKMCQNQMKWETVKDTVTNINFSNLNVMMREKNIN